MTDTGIPETEEKRAEVRGNMGRKDISLIIFDMDGVVLNSEPFHENARQAMFRRLGITEEEDFPEPVGTSASGYWRQVLKRVGLEGDPVALQQEQYQRVEDQIRENHLGPSDGLLEVFDWARSRGMKIGLASSSTQPLVDHTLDLVHVREYFDYVVSGNQVSRKKPDPEIYLRVMEMAGAGPEETVAVEDTAAGIASARAAGIFCYGYDNETSGPQDLSQADRIIRNLREMMEDG